MRQLTDEEVQEAFDWAERLPKIKAKLKGGRIVNYFVVTKWAGRAKFMYSRTPQDLDPDGEYFIDE